MINSGLGQQSPVVLQQLGEVLFCVAASQTLKRLPEAARHGRRFCPPSGPESWVFKGLERVVTLAAAAYHWTIRFNHRRVRGRLPMSDFFDDVTSLRSRLAALQAEHRDLDMAISQLHANPSGDELLVRRLKKRKLALKDRIALIARMLDPDEPA